MVSRRTYVSITAMMLVVCFLFLLPQIVKEKSNPYSVNPYAVSDLKITQAQQWKQPDLNNVDALREVDSYAVFIGSTANELGYAVESWANFSKLPMVTFETIPEAAAYITKKPEVILIDPNYCGFSVEMDQYEQWNADGITLVFCRLPVMEQLVGNDRLQNFLGIKKIEKTNITMSAIRLFDGFLLGGERIYGLETEQDRQMMDLNLEAPWITLCNGTETYIQGELPLEILPEQSYRNEKLPALVWRSALNGTNVFVVNGDYLSGSTGIGFLSAIMAENSSYYLYPVVNAQVMTVANFPGMADENNDVMLSRYGRGHVALTRDLLWPSLESMSEINGFRMSCFEMPQYHYYDGQEPDSYLISYYLRLMRERNAEAGVSLQHGDDISLAEKWDRDQAFLTQDAQEYRYNAAFLTSRELEEWSGELDFSAVSANLQGRDGVFFFLDEDTLCQAVTHDLLNYTFQSDLELCCMQTALAYTNPMLDMRRVSWPEAEEAGWEVYYERSASNLHTYWKVFKQFDRITVSESDRRIRAFLSMDYTQSRVGDTITLEITGFDAEADFILRTHKEVVSQVVGGTAEELEQGAWLIRADSPHVELTVKVDALYEY